MRDRNARIDSAEFENYSVLLTRLWFCECIMHPSIALPAEAVARRESVECQRPRPECSSHRLETSIDKLVSNSNPHGSPCGFFVSDFHVSQRVSTSTTGADPLLRAVAVKTGVQRPARPGMR